MIIGEIFVSPLYRQNYLADDYRRDFGILIIQTELPRRRFNIGEILVSLSYRQNYLADDLISARFWYPWFILIIQREYYLADNHRRDFGSSLLYRQNYLADDNWRNFGIFIIQTELPRR